MSSVEQRKARERLMVDQARRLIDAVESVRQPARPKKTNQHVDPGTVAVDVQKLKNDAMAAQVAEALRARDRGNER